MHLDMSNNEIEKGHQRKVLERIFNLLAESNISQKEFALMLHMSPQTISDWKKRYSNILHEKASGYCPFAEHYT